MPLEARAESAPRDEDHARGATRAGRGPIAHLGPVTRQTKILGDLETIQKVAPGIFTGAGQWPESRAVNDRIRLRCWGSDGQSGGNGEAAAAAFPRGRS